jgi:branched-chain amino acid transport system permease protein
MAIGGLGSFRGCIAGGLIVGLIVGITPVYVNPNLTEPIVYLFLIFMFIARPIGLFGSAGHFGTGGLREV